MAGRKPSRGEIDRFSGHAITSVSKNTPEQQKAIDAINARLAKRTATKQKTAKKK